MGIQPFAAVGRRSADGNPLEPDLMVVAGGVLHRFRVSDDGGAEEERVELPQLRGAQIASFSARRMPHTERIAVTIGAAGAAGEIAVMGRYQSPRQWFPYPGITESRPGLKTMLLHARDIGYLRDGNEWELTYVCAPPGVAAYGFAPDGAPFVCDLVAPPFSRPVVDAKRTFSLAVVRGAELSIHPLARGFPETVLRWDLDQPSERFTLPAAPNPPDSSYLLPIADPNGIWQGMFVRGSDDALYAMRLTKHGPATGTLTRPADGPRSIVRVAWSRYRVNELHVFGVDRDGTIWYLFWSENADTLVWESTGHSAQQLEMPDLMGEEPFVFVERAGGGVDRIARSGPQQWERKPINRAVALLARP